MTDISETITSLMLSQGPDPCDVTRDYAQTLQVMIEECGDAPYAVIETYRWAVKGGDDLREVANKIDALLESYNRKESKCT
jgi:hypothetical protein